jgi:hypothetical protein
MIYAKEKATGKILASNSDCTVESMLSDITSDGTKAEDVVVAEATEEQIKTWIAGQIKSAMSYSDKRANEYPDYRIYLDAIVKGDDTQKQKYIDDCLAVKQKFKKN